MTKFGLNLEYVFIKWLRLVELGKKVAENPSLSGRSVCTLVEAELNPNWLLVANGVILSKSEI